ncbi:MAG: NADP-dependent 3-hydroxy acid dehydrogenase YdfG [Polaribacter sp.]|jgi:NADP-dependent 3-hydroxy acid dehydrogenase YdfG
MTGLTKSISLDGREHDIVCSQIDIGNAVTPLTKNSSKGVPQANGSIQAEPVIDVDTVAQAIVQMAVLPLEMNVQFMTLMTTKMAYIGRGYLMTHCYCVGFFDMVGQKACKPQWYDRTCN